MTSFIQKERIFKLESLDPKELVFEMLEIRGEELKISFPMLATKGNQLTLLDILT